VQTVQNGFGESEWLDAKMVDGKLSVCQDGTWVDETTLAIAKGEFVKSPIALVSPTVHKDQYSQSSIHWLEWVAHNQRIRIIHALNGGEFRLDGTKYKLDGYCVTTNTAYEFHEYIFHGCPTCFPHDRDRIKHPRTRQSMEELYALTMKKKQ